MKNKKRLIVILSVIVLLIVVLGSILILGNDSDNVLENETDNLILTITEAGEYSNLHNYETIIIKTDNVTLTDVDVNKISIDENVNSESIYLKNVVADEINIVGGSNIYVYESVIIDFVISNNTTILSIDENTSITNLEVYNIQELSTDSIINSFILNDSDNDSIINIKENAIINNFELKSITDLTVYGGIEELSIYSINDLEINIDSNGYIKNLITDVPTILNGDGTVYLVTTDTKDNITGNIEPLDYEIDEIELILSYVVTFDSNGGSSVSSETVIENETASKPTTPTRSGYTFVEWQYNGKTYDFSTEITSNITLTASWSKNESSSSSTVATTYKVTFDSNSGSSVSSQTITKNETASKPTTPTRSGYTFVEWQYNGKTYDFSTKVTSNITLTAVWEKNISTYKVTFDSNGGSSVSSQTITESGTASKPTTPTRSGYTFVEWQYNGKTYDFSTKVTSNITLTAVWEKDIAYTITISAVDSYSPSRIMTVYANGVEIGFSSITYTDGISLCTGTNPYVSTTDVDGETEFLVILTNGTTVSAKVN